MPSPQLRRRQGLCALAAVVQSEGLLERSDDFGHYHLSAPGLEQYMRLDAPALQALNVFPGPRDPNVRCSLAGVLDHCVTQQVWLTRLPPCLPHDSMRPFLLGLTRRSAHACCSAGCATHCAMCLKFAAASTWSSYFSATRCCAHNFVTRAFGCVTALLVLRLWTSTDARHCAGRA